MGELVEQKIGNYRLQQLLGKGAFADVYLGEHLYLNTPVAIKILHARLDSAILADFLSEARHISQLVHPHIVRVFDFGQESEAPFLVMDYAPYGNLRELHPSGSAVSFSTIVSYTMALASALQCAHDQHLVHRDLKPENVLLGSKHEVLLSDFGLALLVSDQELLRVKERFGTLSYMAPELILGEPVPASDQYALAVMVYEWLCGHLPFSGSSVHISHQQLYAAPPSLCERYPEIPRAVEQVVMKGLSKEPAHRFVDVLSFARAFEEACHAFTCTNISTPFFESELHHDTQPLHFQDVPFPLTSLIGRETELDAVRDLLMRPEVRLVTVTGTGGVGKTHLALALAHALQATCVDGVSFVSLANVYDSELVLPAIAHALGLQEQAMGVSLSLLKACLRETHLILILDNFEQVLPAAPLLTNLLTACPGLTMLVTSRAVLHVWGEHIYRLQPLEVPDLSQGADLERLSQIASAALFVQRAQAVFPAFHLTEEYAHDVAAICARLEGMPLALELAAAQCQVFSPHALACRLDHSLDLLTGGRRDAPLRHQTWREMLRWNDDVLSAEEQQLFRRLAIFEGGFSVQAAEDLLSAFDDVGLPVLEGLMALLDKSMLQSVPSPGEEPRLCVFETMRAYGLELLAGCGELERSRDAHASYCEALTEASVCDGEQATWRIRVLREEGNVIAAVEWLLEKHERDRAVRMATAFQNITQEQQEDQVLRAVERKTSVHEGASYQIFELDSAYKELTTREIEVLRLLAMGLSNKQIAEQLVLSPHTVSGHIQSIFGKLALNSRSAATRYALEHHLA